HHARLPVEPPQKNDSSTPPACPRHGSAGRPPPITRYSIDLSAFTRCRCASVSALDLATGGPPSMRLSVFGTGRSQLRHSLFEAGGTTLASPSMTGFGLALWSSGPTKGPTERVGRHAVSQVGLDRERGVAAEECAIDLYVLHHALHIVAGFHERDALDPVYGIDLWVARIAKPLDPLPHPPTPGIVGRKRQDVVAAIVLH